MVELPSLHDTHVLNTQIHTYAHTHARMLILSGSVVHPSVKQPQHLSGKKTISVCNQAQTTAAEQLAAGYSCLLGNSVTETQTHTHTHTNLNSETHTHTQKKRGRKSISLYVYIELLKLGASCAKVILKN